MTSRAVVKREVRGIKIAARMAELRRLAEQTARAYDEALGASGLPREHFNLRMMLLGRLLAPRSQATGRNGASDGAAP